MKKPKVIAEIGCNHLGSIGLAKDMIRASKQYANVDIVKFQKRCNKELLSEEQYNAPHPNSQHSYGETYGEHREFLEFTLEEHRELKEYCDEIGVIYSSSTWDLTSAKEIASLNPQFIKIPSARNNDYAMLEWLCHNYMGEIHISTGMTTNRDIENIVSFFENKNRAKDLVLYSCTSGYPVPFEDVCLYEIIWLKERYNSRVKDIGFSGHHLGIAVDIAALTLGAKYIERHFTLDRTWKGTDHAASLEIPGLSRLVRDVDAVSRSLTYKHKEILDIEEVQYKKLKS